MTLDLRAHEPTCGSAGELASAARIHGAPSCGPRGAHRLSASTPTRSRRWTFRAEEARHEGALRVHQRDSAAIERLVVNDRVVVLYLPSDPRVNTLYVT